MGVCENHIIFGLVFHFHPPWAIFSFHNPVALVCGGYVMRWYVVALSCGLPPRPPESYRLCTPSIATLSNFEIPSSQFHHISFTIQLSRFQTVTREFQNPISKYNREISDCNCQISTYPDPCISMPATDGGRNCIWSPFRKPSCLPGPGETTMRRAIDGQGSGGSCYSKHGMVYNYQNIDFMWAAGKLWSIPKLVWPIDQQPIFWSWPSVLLLLSYFCWFPSGKRT